MRDLSLLALALILVANCGKHVSPTDDSGNVNQNQRPVVTGLLPEPADNSRGDAREAEKKARPAAFKDIDFRNFLYVTSLRPSLRLQDGNFEYANPEGGGDTVELAGVSYVDLTGDGKEEAVVELLQVSCGGSCDGGSHLFYFYSSHNSKPKPVWRFETGSLGYGCGLKSFVVRKRQMTLETFNNCRFNGPVLESSFDPNETGDDKFRAVSFTRLVLEFDGKTFAPTKRELFPYPEGDVRNYSAKVSVSDAE
jgi:hypothetical protein